MAPVVFVTAVHERLGVKHDASTTWAEDVTKASFKVCVRELQNFDGAHERIKIVSKPYSFQSQFIRQNVLIAVPTRGIVVAG